MNQKNNRDTAAGLLLSYISLLSSRNGKGPGDGFEFTLWDAMSKKKSKIVTPEERDEISRLTVLSEQWATYNLDTRMLELIQMHDWLEVLEHRNR